MKRVKFHRQPKLIAKNLVPKKEGAFPKNKNTPRGPTEGKQTKASR
jgi:hypothetical protein